MLRATGAESWGPLYFEHLYYSCERLADIFGVALDEAPALATRLPKTPLKRVTVEFQVEISLRSCAGFWCC